MESCVQLEIGNVSRACGLSDFRYVTFAPANCGKHEADSPKQIVKPTALIQPDETSIDSISEATNSLIGIPHAARFQLFAEIRTVSGMPTSMTGVPVSGCKLVSASRPAVASSRRPARSVSARILKR